VTVTPSDGRKAATFGKGDFVTFPAGMSCTWDVTEAGEQSTDRAVYMPKSLNDSDTFLISISIIVEKHFMFF
jgi:hypothetical protein